MAATGRTRGMKRFSAEVYEGHSDCAVIVPFDPAKTWKTTPRRIGYGKHLGHAVEGSIDGVRFEGWIWFYFHEWRMVIPDAVLAAAGAEPGDSVKVSVRAHPKPEMVAPYQPGAKRR